MSVEDARKRHGFIHISIAPWKDPSVSILPARGGPKSPTISASAASKPFMPTYKVSYTQPRLPEPTDDEDSGSEDEPEPAAKPSAPLEEDPASLDSPPDPPIDKGSAEPPPAAPPDPVAGAPAEDDALNAAAPADIVDTVDVALSGDRLDAVSHPHCDIAVVEPPPAAPKPPASEASELAMTGVEGPVPATVEDADDTSAGDPGAAPDGQIELPMEHAERPAEHSTPAEEATSPPPDSENTDVFQEAEDGAGEAGDDDGTPASDNAVGVVEADAEDASPNAEPATDLKADNASDGKLEDHADPALTADETVEKGKAASLSAAGDPLPAASIVGAAEVKDEEPPEPSAEPTKKQELEVTETTKSGPEVSTTDSSDALEAADALENSVEIPMNLPEQGDGAQNSISTAEEVAQVTESQESPTDPVEVVDVKDDTGSPLGLEEQPAAEQVEEQPAEPSANPDDVVVDDASIPPCDASPGEKAAEADDAPVVAPGEDAPDTAVIDDKPEIEGEAQTAQEPAEKTVTEPKADAEGPPAAEVETSETPVALDELVKDEDAPGAEPPAEAPLEEPPAAGDEPAVAEVAAAAGPPSDDPVAADTVPSMPAAGRPIVEPPAGTEPMPEEPVEKSVEQSNSKSTEEPSGGGAPPQEAPPSPTLSKSSSKRRADHWERKPSRNHTSRDTKAPKSVSSKRSSGHGKDEVRSRDRPHKSRRSSMTAEEEAARRRRREVRKAEEAARIAEAERRRLFEEELQDIRHEARRAARKAAAEEAARLAREEAERVARNEAEARRKRHKEGEREGERARESERPRRERRESMTKAPLFFRTDSGMDRSSKQYTSSRSSRRGERPTSKRGASPLVSERQRREEPRGKESQRELSVEEAPAVPGARSSMSSRRYGERSESDKPRSSRRDGERRSQRSRVEEKPRSFFGMLLRSF